MRTIPLNIRSFVAPTVDSRAILASTSPAADHSRWCRSARFTSIAQRKGARMLSLAASAAEIQPQACRAADRIIRFTPRRIGRAVSAIRAEADHRCGDAGGQRVAAQRGPLRPAPIPGWCPPRPRPFSVTVVSPPSTRHVGIAIVRYCPAAMPCASLGQRPPHLARPPDEAAQQHAVVAQVARPRHGSAACAGIVTNDDVVYPAKADRRVSAYPAARRRCAGAR